MAKNKTETFNTVSEDKILDNCGIERVGLYYYLDLQLAVKVNCSKSAVHQAILLIY